MSLDSVPVCPTAFSVFTRPIPTFGPTTQRQRELGKPPTRCFPVRIRSTSKSIPRVTLIDCGENLERINCPRCGAAISDESWAERLDELAAGEGWELADVDAPLTAPCCQRDVTLRTLRYHWPVGFARFTVDIWNPEPRPDEPTGPAQAVSQAIGVPMSGLWAHY
jgi:hypothetical protein